MAADLRDELISIVRRSNPLIHEPLATKVAVEWVDDHILPQVRDYAAGELERAAETMTATVDRYKLRGIAKLIRAGEDPYREVRATGEDA